MYRYRAPSLTFALMMSLICLPAGNAYAQQAVQRDALAVSLIQQSITATGGQTAVSQVSTAMTTGTIAPVAGSQAKSGTFTWKDQFTTSGYEFRNEFQSGGVTRLFVSGLGQPATSSGRVARKLRPHMRHTALPYHLPAILLSREVANPNCGFALLQPQTIANRSAVHIQVSNSGDPVLNVIGVQDWYLDTVSSLPLRVEFRTPDWSDPMAYEVIRLDYSNYQQVGGLMVPFQMSVSQAGAPVSVNTVSSVVFNIALDSSEFQIAGAQ